MRTYNIGFNEDLTKIIFELSSNTHLISSADCCVLVNRLEGLSLPRDVVCLHFLHYFHAGLSNHLPIAISMSPEWMVA